MPALAGACLALLGTVLAPASLAQPSSGTEIVNVAICEYGGDPNQSPGGPPDPNRRSIPSNPVTTPVAADCFDGAAILSVLPAGTVDPGTGLVFTLEVENRFTVGITDLRVTLPFHPDLQDPEAYTSGPQILAGGQAADVQGSWDPVQRVLAWDVDALPGGSILALEFQARASPTIVQETLVEMQADLEADNCGNPGSSNRIVVPVVPPLLRLGKFADRTTAAAGDGIVYEVRVSHEGEDPVLVATEVDDVLPPGFRFVPGSGRIDGLQAEDPSVSANGRNLRFDLGPLAPGETRVLRYAAMVSVLAERGDAVNRATASGRSAAGSTVRSNPGAAVVAVVPGPFRRDATLAGRVFVDVNEDGLPTEDEPGVPGVLVLTEGGRGAVTDVTGRWHIAAVQPGTHVVRVDPVTLPAGLLSRNGGAEWGGDRLTRFVEVRSSTLAVADVPLDPPNAPSCRLGGPGASLLMPASSLLGSDGRPARGAPAILESAADWLVEGGARDPEGIHLTCTGAGDDERPGAGKTENRLRELVALRLELPAPEILPGVPASTDAEGEEEAVTTDPLEDVVREETPGTRILSPTTGATAERSRIDVEVLFPIESAPNLEVNDRPVPADRIGTRSELPSRGLAAARYVGVELKPGRNRLEFRSVAPGLAAEAVPPVETIVVLPGEAATLRIHPAGDRWIADGTSPGVIRVEAVDGSGTRINGRLVVTVEAEGAEPLTADRDESEEGLQVRLERGAAEVRFAPLATPGEVRIRAVSGPMEVKTTVPVHPGGVGGWRVVGLAEANVAGDAGVEGDGGLPPDLGGQVTGSGGRVAVFARGPVFKKSQLTARLDTERRKDPNRFFSGQVEPDVLYPVYGDGSLGVEMAESQDKLYARLDGPNGFARYGDFVSGFDNADLARYDRTFTGLSGVARSGRVRFEGFATSSDQQLVRHVFQPDGTSGPYLLPGAPVLARSESVFVEVRDRFRTDRVLRRTLKTRDLEYSLDSTSGVLLFRAPVPPFDPEMNPMRVVVLYETRPGGDDRITAGGRVGLQLGGNVETGVTLVGEERVGNSFGMAGLDLTWQPNPGTKVRTEVASTDEGYGSATAFGLEVTSRTREDLAWEISYRDLPLDYANPSYLGSPELGSRRAGGSVHWTPNEHTSLRGEAYTQKDVRIQTERTAIDLVSEHRYSRFNFLIGATAVAAENPAHGRVTSALLRAGGRARLARRWSAELFRDQVVTGEAAPGYPTRTRVGVAFEISPTARAFLRQEFEDGSDGVLARDRTLLGIEGALGRYTRGTAGYSLESGRDGTAVRAMTGVETVFPISPRQSVNLAASRLDTARGDPAQDFTTLAGAYEYRAGRSLASARYEVRFGDTELRQFLTGAGAVRLGEDWTVFLRERLFSSDPDHAGGSLRAEGLYGVAYRPLAGRVQFVSRFDHSLGTGGGSGAGSIPPGGVDTQPVSSVTNTPTRPDRPGVGVGLGRESGVFERNWFSLSVAVGSRVTNRQRVAATWIGRHVDGDSGVGLASTLTSLTSLHYTAEVHRRWTVGGSARWYRQSGTGTGTFGYGAEAGFLTLRNLWIVGGYNFAGIEDRHFPINDRTDQGPFLSIRFKFDEKSLTQWGDLRLDK